MRIVILTGSFLRHDFLRKAIALDPEIRVLKSYCEITDRNLAAVIDSNKDDASLQYEHLEARQQSERDFFYPFVSLTPDYSNSVRLPFGHINKKKYVDEIIALNPDLLVAYGCSIIKEFLLDAFSGRILNVHLGLSPYYRGTGTNFWPLVNGEPEFVGATFMFMNSGIDTGEIIHQIRAEIRLGDTPHQIGNRLISDMAGVYRTLIRRFNHIEAVEQIPVPEDAKFYLRKRFSPDSVRQLYANFKAGMIQDYLAERENRIERVPIINNPSLTAY
ncbi:MAG: hypothetical protein JRL30_12960 [Deltaproteobacteria bacterium]|nr:hypothetical protein [Deltaproteobacteria bacterium]